MCHLPKTAWNFEKIEKQEEKTRFENFCKIIKAILRKRSRVVVSSLGTSSCCYHEHRYGKNPRGFTSERQLSLGVRRQQKSHGEPPDHSIIETLRQEAGRG